MCNGETLEGFRQRRNRLMCSFNIIQTAAWRVMRADKRGTRGAIGRPVQWSRSGGEGICIRKHNGATESKWINGMFWRESKGTH